MTIRNDSARALPPQLPSRAPAAGNVSASTAARRTKATTQEVDIATLQRKFGWEPGSWQSQLLQAADGGGGKGNGKVSAAELDKYLANPTDVKFLTSTVLQQEREAFAAKRGGNGLAAVDAFDAGWKRQVAQEADTRKGNADGQLSADELQAWMDDAKKARGPKDAPSSTAWLPDQKAAMMRGRIADFTGEVDTLKVSGPGRGTELLKEYMRLSMDEQKNVPTWVSYMLSAADIRETPVDVNRDKSKWQQDKALKNPVTGGDYTRSGFDRGHMKPAESSPTQEAMDESHLMSNIAPQYGNLNQQAWRTLEEAVHELTLATGGKATIITGNLFLDSRNRALPPESIPTIGSSGRRIAVPTHCFKTVLLELPNGHMTMFGFMMPNAKDAPKKREDIAKLLEASRLPVDRIEELLGQDLYAQLPADVQKRLEADPAAKVEFLNAGQYHAATLLWPQKDTARA
jgi:endonuclease G